MIPAIALRRTTAFLWDSGEEDWETKLHLGCGGIYLEGYTNWDIVGKRADQYPDHVVSDIADYYGGLEGSAERLPTRRETVVDCLGNFVDPPYQPDTVDKIVCVQALEHLGAGDVDLALNRWWNILKPRGVLIVSVPRMDDTLEWLDDLDEERRAFAVRHLKGSRRDPFNRHRSWFNAGDLEWLLREHGFEGVKLMPNFHLYPALVYRAHKADARLSGRQYQTPLPEFDRTCKTVLDVGPGEFPLSLATRCFDVSDQYKKSRLVPCDTGNVERLPYADDSYDFVYCSHVLEHTQNPMRAMSELIRVGKRGFIEVPSVMLDWFMQHGNAHLGADGEPTRWMCVQGNNTLIFVERSPELLPGFTDVRWGTWVHRMMHYTIRLDGEEKYLRKRFWETQETLNASVSWNEDDSRARGVCIRLDGTIERTED